MTEQTPSAGAKPRKLCKREGCGQPAVMAVKVVDLGGGFVPYCQEDGESAAKNFIDLHYNITTKDIREA